MATSTLDIYKWQLPDRRIIYNDTHLVHAEIPQETSVQESMQFRPDLEPFRRPTSGDNGKAVPDEDIQDKGKFRCR